MRSCLIIFAFSNQNYYNYNVDKKQKNDFIFILFLFTALFLFLASLSIPQTETIDCNNGIISANIESKPLEYVTAKLSDACNMTIYLDEKAKGTTITINFKSYPVPYAISKLVEGTGLNFIIYQDQLSEKPWAIYIGPSRNPGEQGSLVSQGTSKNANPNPSRPYNPSSANPAPASVPLNEVPAAKPAFNTYPNYTVNPGSVAPNIVKPLERKLEKPMNIPTAGSPSSNQPPAFPKKYDVPGTKKPIPNPKQPLPSPTPPNMPQQTPQNPPPRTENPPPNTGSG